MKETLSGIVSSGSLVQSAKAYESISFSVDGREMLFSAEH